MAEPLSDLIGGKVWDARHRMTLSLIYFEITLDFFFFNNIPHVHS